MTKAFYPTGYIAPISTCETIGWNGVEPPVKWKLFTRNEEPMPPLESFHTEEYDSKEAALEAAYQMMYGLTRLPHMKVPYIVEPNGKRIESEEIQDWCKKRSQQSAGS